MDSARENSLSRNIMCTIGNYTRNVGSFVSIGYRQKGEAGQDRNLAEHHS